MKRSAFTLIELLVIVVIIGLLAAIMLPTINMAREAARRGQCVAKQRDLALAMIEYSNAYNGLPGYLNQLGNTPIHSWTVAIMPNIGENRRYEVLMKTAPNEDELKRAIAPLFALLCPSDNPKEDGRLNYVVNCGPTDATLDFYDFMLFKDRRSPLASVNTKYKIEDIPDGATNTILLSESVLFPGNTEGFWYRDWSVLPGDSPRRNMMDVNHFGFIWGRSNEYLPVSSVRVSASVAEVPRPSSRHPGTVVSAFADGSVRALNDDLSLGDWLRLACPDYAGWEKRVVLDQQNY